MNFSSKTEQSFLKIADDLFASLIEGEELNLSLNAEDSLFVRFNGNKVRQNTWVEQAVVSAQFQKDKRTTNLSFNITGHFEQDQHRSQLALATLRSESVLLPEDPHQVKMVNNGKSHNVFKGELLDPEFAISSITEAAKGTDLAGLYCSGTVISANRNSLGQSHWFQSESFFMDFSLYDGERAVKGSYAGSTWDQKQFESKVKKCQDLLQLMSRPKKTLQPGSYRTYLAPAAMAEVSSMLGWGSFGYNDYKLGNLSLRKLVEKEKTFSPLINIKENFKLGLSPRFNQLGEVAPVELPLIEKGEFKNFLISSRSSQEYGVASNFAAPSESPRALDIGPGGLAEKDILKELGTGLYLSNLHYLNWSDRQNARITGMTRYACFWVENGEIQAPIADMRFDDSLFEIFGQNLEDLTAFQEVDSSVDTYYARSIGGKLIPGALLKSFHLTL